MLERRGVKKGRKPSARERDAAYEAELAARAQKQAEKAARKAKLDKERAARQAEKVRKAWARMATKRTELERRCSVRVSPVGSK